MNKLLTEHEYVDEHRYLLRRLHQHDGVWWNQVFPGYAKPAFQFRKLVPGSARPDHVRSVLGYRHHVPELAMGNQVVDYLILEGEDLRKFGLDRLRPDTRNHVRKGFRRCEVKEIIELEPYLEDARQVCISHSNRLADSRLSYHVSDSHFVEKADSWREQMRRDFRSRGRTWWGAFSEGRLIAYMVMLHVEDVMILDKMKVHKDALTLHASDALYFTALEHAGATGTCQRIFNSPPQREGLDRFKIHYLFKPTPVPFYISNLSVYRSAIRMARIRENLVLRLKRIRRAKSPLAGGLTTVFADSGSKNPDKSTTSLRADESAPRAVP